MWSEGMFYYAETVGAQSDFHHHNPFQNHKLHHTVYYIDTILCQASESSFLNRCREMTLTIILNLEHNCSICPSFGVIYGGRNKLTSRAS